MAKAGLVDPSWNAGPAKGIVSRSVVVIAVRKGNPKGIKTWADLVKPGVGIVTADPGTSGSAKWNLMAAAARAAGVELDYVVPDSTLLIENPAAATKTAPAQAAAFLTFVASPDGQKILGSRGFRSIDDGLKVTGVVGANDPANPFPAVAHLTTIADLGGWTAVNKTFFDKETGLVTGLRKR